MLSRQFICFGLVLGAGALALLANGCSDEVVGAIGEASAAVDPSARKTPVPGDPWGTCIPDPSLELGAKCSNNGLTCAGDLANPTPSTSCTSGFADQDRLTCIYECTTDADCPVPLSGDATGACVLGLCWLGCDHGETCPNGLTCVVDSPWGPETTYEDGNALGPPRVAPFSLCMSPVTVCTLDHTGAGGAGH
jgi:hypothetical protein